MDSTDVIDEVNTLLKLGVGDSYRLEHIKQAYIQNKTIWITDENYLKRMREKYLTKHTSDIDSADLVFENEPKNKEMIHCWKCGKKGPLDATFCMVCGTALFDIGNDSSSSSESKSNSSRFGKSIPLKIPMIIGIPVLVLIILGVGYTQGYFDNVLNSMSPFDETSVIEKDVVLPVDPDSPCGSGTVFDPETNSCILNTASNTVNIDEPSSQCGPGTIFNPKTNSCDLR